MVCRLHHGNQPDLLAWQAWHMEQKEINYCLSLRSSPYFLFLGYLYFIDILFYSRLFYFIHACFISFTLVFISFTLILFHSRLFYFIHVCFISFTLVFISFTLVLFHSRWFYFSYTYYTGTVSPKTSGTVSSFKSQLKTFLFSEYFS